MVGRSTVFAEIVIVVFGEIVKVAMAVSSWVKEIIVLSAAVYGGPTKKGLEVRV